MYVCVSCAADFIARVTGYGPCIIMARSQGGAVFGGYNPLGFDGQGADKGSMGAFLYTWPDGDTKVGTLAALVSFRVVCYEQQNITRQKPLDLAGAHVLLVS